MIFGDYRLWKAESFSTDECYDCFTSSRNSADQRSENAKTTPSAADTPVMRDPPVMSTLG